MAATAWLKINELEKRLDTELGYSQDPEQMAHLTYLQEQLRLFKQEPGEWKMPPAPAMPDGSPIGHGMPAQSCGW